MEGKQRGCCDGTRMPSESPPGPTAVNHAPGPTDMDSVTEEVGLGSQSHSCLLRTARRSAPHSTWTLRPQLDLRPSEPELQTNKEITTNRVFLFLFF